jgi:hypothetical protein
MAEGSGSTYWVHRIIRLAEEEGGELRHPIVLMHNEPIGNPAAVGALPSIIQFFRTRGYGSWRCKPREQGTSSAQEPRHLGRERGLNEGDVPWQRHQVHTRPGWRPMTRARGTTARSAQIF